MGRARLDLIGQRFGRLIVVEFAGICGKDRSRKSLWYCKCDCGNTIIAKGNSLKTRNTTSCGCSRYKITELNTGNTYRRIGYGEANFNSLYCSYKYRATKKNYNWGLSKEDFRLLTSSNCVYCGRLPEQIYKHNDSSYGGYTYNGIDRKNNSRGYTLENVVSCCWKCNLAKGSMSEQEFIQSSIQRADYLRSTGKYK
jgi:5-methylcytosine-specific restriction endonuclease McrA